MSSLANVLRDEITQIVQREVKLALKAIKASAPAAPKAAKTRKGSKSVAAGAPRVEMDAKDLVALRGKLAISGPEYARLAGVSVATIYNWEKAKGSVSLRAQTAASVARLQGLTAEQARAELGPAKKRGRQPKAAAEAKAAAPAKGKPGRKPGKAAKAPAAEAGPSVSVTSKEILALRKKLAVSGPELARLVGVSVASIYNWEKAKEAVSLRAPAGAALVRVQGLTAESARAELGPAKKRGRQPKAAAVGAAPAEAPKKRGRPGRKPKAAAEAAPVEAPKKRGRPGRKPKVVVAAPAAAAPAEAPKKRGRPGRKPKVVEAAPVAAPVAAEAPKKRGRPGRKPKGASAELPF